MAEFGGARRRRLRASLASLGCAAALAISGSSLVGALVAPTAAAAPSVEEQPLCPTEGANARFVRYIYLSILDRCPDDGGLGFWATALDRGLPRATFTDIIDMSDENIVNNNVLPLYGELLDREPSTLETIFWSAVIRNDKADDRMIAWLASTDEFWNALEGPDSERTGQWLDQAYSGILDRDIDEAAYWYFSAVLGPNPTAAQRFDVAFYLERSDENVRSWVGAVYFAALNRPPDGGGAKFWNDWLLQTHQTFRMWTHFLASDEAYALAQTQPYGSVPDDVARKAGGRLLAAKKAHAGS